MPIIEHRRIYAAGHSLAITLPKGWLAYFKIKAGDKVQVVANGDLTISPEPLTEDAESVNDRQDQG